MLEEKLKLNFPKYGRDVFDQNNDDKFFAYTGEFSNTTNDLDDLSIKQFEKYVPMGYKSIQICKRTKLIINGLVSKEWRHELEHENKFLLLVDRRYKLYVPNWKREIETTTIYKPNFIDLSAESAIWQNIDECTKYGVEFSKTDHCEVLIASRVELINWH